MELTKLRSRSKCPKALVQPPRVVAFYDHPQHIYVMSPASRGTRPGGHFGVVISGYPSHPRTVKRGVRVGREGGEERGAGDNGSAHLIRNTLEAHIHNDPSVRRSFDLCPYLVLAAKDVRVVLLEPSHTGQSGQRSTELVPVQHAKVCVAHGEVAVAAQLRGKHDAVAGAVHGLERKHLGGVAMMMMMEKTKRAVCVCERENKGGG